MSDPGSRLAASLADRYHIERELGAGGMATVYLARDLKHGRRVAIKVLRPELAALLGGDRFRREIELAARLQHPHILGLIDSGEIDGLLYYIMPFVEGESLRQVLERERVLPVDRVLRLGVQMAEALDYAHRNGVVHRDIKPENILLQDGQATLADFGIALAVRDGEGQRLTQAGFSLGTPAYMSPEQVTGGHEVDGRSDQYSLACVLFELLTGEPPFGGPTAQAVMVKHVTEGAPGLPASLPPGIATAVARALAKNPSDRFSTAAEMATALATSSEGARPVPTRVIPLATIVVLPFEDVSPDPSDTSFTTGLTDEVISDLSRVKAIRVISRNTSMRLRGTTKDLRTIGQELKVKFALTGSVRRAGDALRITTELVDTESDTPVWAEKYSGNVSEVFALQERISRRIVDELQVTVTPEESRRLAVRGVEDLRVQGALVRVRDAMYTYDPGAANLAALELHELIAATGETGNLLAWLALLYAHRVNIGAVSRDPALEVGRKLALRAIDLAPDLAIPYYGLGYLEFAARGALAALPPARLAVEREHSADALMNLGCQLAMTGIDLDEAVTLLDDAVARDPLTPVFRVYRGIVLLWAGRPEAAAESFYAGIATGTPLMLASCLLAYCVDRDEALRVLETAPRSGGIYEEFAAVFADALRGRRPSPSPALVAHTREAQGSAAWSMAGPYAMVDDREQALAWMEVAIERGFTNERVWTEWDPFMSRYRDDPKFQALLVRARELRLTV